MPREIEEPITEKHGPDWRDETITRHPAFAQIVANRVSGGAMLYGSDFQHQNYISVKISRSELHRTLSNDWHFGRDELIAVDMSEAQWATFVSSLNVGSGVPCTIDHIDRDMMPGLPKPKVRKDQFKQEARKACEEGLLRMQAIAEEIKEMKISQKAKDDLIKKMQHATASFTGSLPFVLDQFGEHMEDTVEKAKIEINAYATNMVMRTGIAALAQKSTDDLLTYDTGEKSEPTQKD